MTIDIRSLKVYKVDNGIWNPLYLGVGKEYDILALTEYSPQVAPRYRVINGVRKDRGYNIVFTCSTSMDDRLVIDLIDGNIQVILNTDIDGKVYSLKLKI